MTIPLNHHREKQVERRLKVGEAWKNRDLVFPDPSGGYLNPIHVLRMFKKILQRAGLPHMPFHDLRHSAVTLLLQMGVPAHVVQEIAGHADISTTQVYTHMALDRLRSVYRKHHPRAKAR